jgi:hypothetical protein
VLVLDVQIDQAIDVRGGSSLTRAGMVRCLNCWAARVRAVPPGR